MDNQEQRVRDNVGQSHGESLGACSTARPESGSNRRRRFRCDLLGGYYIARARRRITEPRTTHYQVMYIGKMID